MPFLVPFRWLGQWFALCERDYHATMDDKAGYSASNGDSESQVSNRAHNRSLLQALSCEESITLLQVLCNSSYCMCGLAANLEKKLSGKSGVVFCQVSKIRLRPSSAQLKTQWR